jgi:hypothetical protein
MSVIFDQLRIADDGRKIYINLHVNKADYFENVYIDSLTIITADKVLETSSTVPSEDYVYTKIFDGEVKEINLVLQPTDFNEKFLKSNFSSDLFFVYAKVKGTPDICTPCRLDEEITLGVFFDENVLYQKVMQFTKSLADNCKLPVGFMDFILLWNAFKASVETEHYILAVKYYNMLFDRSNINTSSETNKNCGCYG